jgi:GAF domain-containing protein
MMWSRIRQFVAPPIFEGDEDKTRIAAQLNLILWTFAVIVVVVGLAVPFLFLSQGLTIAAVLGGLVLLTSGMLFVMRRGQVRLAGGIFSLGMWLLYTLLIVGTGGMTSPVNLTWIVVVIMAGLLLSRRAALGFAGLSVVAGLGIAYLERNGLLPSPLITFSAVGGWLLATAHVGITATLLYLATRSVDDALESARRTAAELEKERGQLEMVVEERTGDLARRTRYLEATTEIARDAVSELDLQALLSRLVGSISQRFGFYHTGIFLIDPIGEWAELRAASSEGGREMVARGHRLRVGEEGIVGYVTGQGRPRVALDVGADAATAAVHFDHPDLPGTRSEVAVPLRARGEIIGALDVQSTEPEAFSEEEVAVLQTLADQIAVAISNTRLFRQVEERVAAERRAYGELSRQAWQAMLRTQPDLGFASYEQGTVPIGDLWESQMEIALHTGVVTTGSGEERTLAVPVKTRGQVIGILDLCKPEGVEEWTADEVALIEILADQLGQAVEGARLYQDTQRHAAREQLVARVTARMRQTLDMETVLRTTANEMYMALGLDEVVIRLVAAQDQIQDTLEGKDDV